VIRVRVPPGYEAERRYICDVLFRTFLGLDYHLVVEERADVAITCSNDAHEQELVLADQLFQTAPAEWLTPASLPQEPLAQWNTTQSPVRAPLVSPQLPVIFGECLPCGSFMQVSEQGVRVGIDVLGSAFFMLSRYEELVRPDRDAWERFPASASLALRAGFLTRPIVNEYLEVLWWALRRLWPSLPRKQRSFRILLSHDVDEIFCVADRTAAQLVRSLAADLVLRRSPGLAARRMRSCWQVRRGDLAADLCNTFNRVMDLSEQHGLRSAFYFMAGKTGGLLDAAYAMADPWVRDLLRRIHARGHEIGLHPSYNTFRDPAQIKREFETLQGVALAESVHQKTWGGRQHFLRWEAPTTWQAWANAGLTYDSTLAYADQVGFRCGACYEFPVFNLRTREALRLHERPLIVMEVTALEYMRLTPAQAHAVIGDLRERCRLFDGDFTLLWHNSRLVNTLEVELYERLLDL
jgi:hypothetical protein